MRQITPNFSSLDIDEVKQLLDNNIPIIDIRREGEFKSTGVIKNAHPLPFFTMFGTYDLDKWLESFTKIVKNKDDKFIITCASANRTKSLGAILQDQGYTNICELDGGMGAWLRSGNEVVAYNK